MAGGYLGVGNDSRYNNNRTFDPFPFPSVLTDPDGDTARLAALGDRLDAERKERLAAWDWLTMTRLYNALERYREAMAGGAPLTEAERDVHERARVTLLAELHDEIDWAVLDAYGWSYLAGDLVGRPGGTTPSAHKTPEQEAAEEALLVRLVALNQERAAEERRGHVRWLRPDYQRAKLGHKVPDGDQAEAELAVATSGPDQPAWPKGGLGPRIRAVRDVLEGAGTPVAPDAVAAAFAGRTTKARIGQVADVLDGLAEMGLARRVEGVGFAAAR